MALPGDVPRIAELCRQGLAELLPTRGGDVFVSRDARGEPIEDDLRAAIEDPHRRLWAGTIDDAIIGYAATHVEQLRDGRTLGVIDDLFVEEGARGVGVGEVLIAQAVAWCREQGSLGVDATALPGNRATKNFFEGSGFTARMLVMHHRFDADGGPTAGSGDDAT
ncbi:MAG TPA: GNAT family N-acetyltransferase [Acidimicrobiales bacterium]|nr:GNAT family N-acetyltransferase [Acidimicrobiales bacterium]